MVDVTRGQQFPSPDGLHRFPDEHAVHDDARSIGKIFDGELVFCRYIRFQQVGLRTKRKPLPSTEVGQRDQHVVFGIEFEHLVLHFTQARLPPFGNRLPPPRRFSPAL